MATRLTLLATTRQLVDESDSSNSHFTDSEVYGFINQAIRYLGTDIEWPLQTAQATAVANQAVYTLPEDFISLADVYFNNDNIAIIERADLSALQQNWQDAPSGIPRYCYKSDNQKVGLWPKPDSTQAGNLLQIQYIKVPPDLSDDTTAPDLHSAFYDCLPFYAAFMFEHSLGNRKAAETNMNLYETHKKRLLSRVQRFSDDTFRFRWSEPRMY